MRVYSYLEEAANHPTVDQIYQELSQELPTLSKTTVYNVLKLFCEHDLVKPVNMSSSEMRYELYHQDHSHFRCTDCGEIYDIPYIKPTYDTTSLKGFQVEEEEVNLSGICPSCLQQKLT
jgi:Fe2+ or Zn2+ uptake regulation protein